MDRSRIYTDKLVSFIQHGLDYKLVTLSLLLAVFVSVISPSIISVLLSTIVLTLVYLFKDKALLVLVIVGYIATPSEYFGESRLLLNLALTLILFFLFIKKFGFDFKNYVKVPIGIIIFLVFLFFSLMLSSLLSQYPIDGFSAIVRMLIFLTISYMLFALLKDNENINIYIYAIIISFLFYGVRIIIDFSNLGIEKFFIRTQIEGITSAGSKSYTGLTIFFISLSFISAFLFGSKHKLLLSILLILNVVILILANSRSGIIAAFLSISFLFIMLRSYVFFKIIAFVIVSIFVLYFTNPVIEETFDLYARWEQVSTREIFWDSGVNIIKDYGVLGIGADTFDKYFYNYAPSTFYQLSGFREGKHSPHNLFLYYFAENGIIGLVISVSFFIMFFYFASKTIRITKEKNKEHFILAVTITGIGIGFLVRSFLEVTGLLYYGFITSDLPFWIIFAILITIYNKFKPTIILNED